MTGKRAGRIVKLIDCQGGRNEAWKRAPWAAIIVRLAPDTYRAFESFGDFIKHEEEGSSDNDSCE